MPTLSEHKQTFQDLLEQLIQALSEHGTAPYDLIESLRYEVTSITRMLGTQETHLESFLPVTLGSVRRRPSVEGDARLQKPSDTSQSGTGA